jgi:hypothetical protein
VSEPLDLDAKKCPTCSGPLDESPVFVDGVAFCDHKCAHSRKGGPLDRKPGDPIEELTELLRASGARPCLWFGLPPCPFCGGNHGDPKATPERDRDLMRGALVALVARVREIEDTYEESVKDRDRLKARVQSLEEERDDADCERLNIAVEIVFQKLRVERDKFRAALERIAEIVTADKSGHLVEGFGVLTPNAAVSLIAREALGRERGGE